MIENTLRKKIGCVLQKNTLVLVKAAPQPLMSSPSTAIFTLALSSRFVHFGVAAAIAGCSTVVLWNIVLFGHIKDVVPEHASCISFQRMREVKKLMEGLDSNYLALAPTISQTPVTFAFGPSTNSTLW